VQTQARTAAAPPPPPALPTAAFGQRPPPTLTRVPVPPGAGVTQVERLHAQLSDGAAAMAKAQEEARELRDKQADEAVRMQVRVRGTAWGGDEAGRWGT
jgi:hypothetical protein